MRKMNSEEFEEELDKTTHYYGDIVRKLFLGGAILMLATLPIYHDLIPVSIYIAIFVIILVGVAAGLTNPLLLWVSVLNILIAAGAFAIFEYYTVDTHAKYSFTHGLFWTNQALALIFLLALYYGVKTARGLLLEEKI